MSRSRPVAGVLGGLLITGLGLWGAPALAADPPANGCKFAKLGELPLKLKNNRPYVEGALNGQKVLFLADTGAFATILFAGAAARLGLPPVGAGELETIGLGGRGTARAVSVREMKLGDFNVPAKFLLVAGATGGGVGDVVGVVGRDIFGLVDVEFDVAAEKIRLFKAENCRDALLSYWSPTPAGGAMVGLNERGSPFALDVKLNGRRVPAELDSGADVTVVSTAAAANAGVELSAGGVNGAGRMRGFGPSAVEAYTATFATLEVGGEVVRNAKLHVADMFAAAREVETGSHLASEPERVPKMLLGADFLRAHRVLIANSQRRIYFTYNGGPIFRLPEPETASKPTPAKAP